MDGVLADFEGGFLKKYRAKYPDEPYITLEDRRGFWVSSQYGQLRSDLCVSHNDSPLPRPVNPKYHCRWLKYAWGKLFTMSLSIVSNVSPCDQMHYL